MILTQTKNTVNFYTKKSEINFLFLFQTAAEDEDVDEEGQVPVGGGRPPAL